MFDEVLRRIGAHRLYDDIQSFATGEFCSRDEIRIGRNQNNLIGLALEGDRCDIQAEPHVDALLPDVDFEICINRSECVRVCDQSLVRFRLQSPTKVIV